MVAKNAFSSTRLQLGFPAFAMALIQSTLMQLPLRRRSSLVSITV